MAAQQPSPKDLQRDEELPLRRRIGKGHPQSKCSISEMKTRLTSYFPACLLGVSSENHGINCETEH